MTSSALKPCVLLFLVFILAPPLHHLSVGFWSLAKAGQLAEASWPLLLELALCLSFGTAPTVQQLIEHSQGSQRQDSEDEEEKDDKTGHIPAVMEWVHLLDLQGDVGERDCFWVPWETTSMCCVSDVGHDF